MLRLLSRQYVLAARIITGCHKDSALTKEELWILSYLPIDDCHPDALACRLRLTLLCRDCGTKPEWKTDKDFECYLSTHSHVSVACRLSENEERRLLSYYPIESRAQFLKAMTNAPAQIAVKGTCQSGGLVLDSVHTELMSRALQANCKSASAGVGGTQLYYDRPEEQVATGASALRLIDTLWAGGLLGWGCRTGFALLYDILLGRRKIEFVTNEAEHARALEGSTAKSINQKMKAQSSETDQEQSRLRNERHKRIREFLTAHDIEIPSAAPSSSNARQSRQTASLPWEKSTLSVPPSLEEAFAAVDGGDRCVTKKSASFVKLMTSAIILKNTRDVSRISLSNPTGVAACILLSLTHAVLHDMPVVSLMGKAKGMAAKLLEQGKREKRTWEFRQRGGEWVSFSEHNCNSLNHSCKEGRTYCYISMECDKLTKPVERASVIRKSDQRWFYVQYSEKTNKYVTMSNRGPEQDFFPSEVLVSAQISLSGNNQTTGRAYVGRRSMEVRCGSVVTTCGLEDLVLENFLDACNEKHQRTSESRLELVPVADTSAATDPERAHATIMTLKRILGNFATWKATSAAWPVSSILSQKKDFEFALHIASAAYAAHLPKCIETGAWPHASTSACAAAVSEWTKSLLTLQKPREGESSIEAKTRFAAEMKTRLAQEPSIEIVPMRVAVVVREADTDVHETQLLVSFSDSFVSVTQRLLRALAKKHHELTERIEAGQCTFSVDGVEAEFYRADDDVTLLSSFTDENEPHHNSVPALHLVLTVSASEKAEAEIVDFSCLPSFPFLRHESKLLARGTSCGSDDLRTFFRSLAGTSLAICNQEQGNKKRKPFKPLVCDVDHVSISASLSLNSAPVPSDCANASKRLRSMAPVEQVHGAWSGISPDDVRAFAASPLDNFGLLRCNDAGDADVAPTEIVSLQPAVADVDTLLAKMPLDLTRCPDAQSAVAQNLLKRINCDLQQSAAVLNKKRVPRLTCLDGFLFILTRMHTSFLTQFRFHDSLLARPP